MYKDWYIFGFFYECGWFEFYLSDSVLVLLIFFKEMRWLIDYLLNLEICLFINLYEKKIF